MLRVSVTRLDHVPLVDLAGVLQEVDRIMAGVER